MIIENEVCLSGHDTSHSFDGTNNMQTDHHDAVLYHHVATIVKWTIKYGGCASVAGVDVNRNIRVILKQSEFIQ